MSLVYRWNGWYEVGLELVQSKFKGPVIRQQ